MTFPRKCVATSGVIYPSRGGWGDRSGRHNPNRNKTAHTRAFKFQSLHSSFQTAAASSQATPARGGRLQIKKYQSRPNSKSERAEMCPPRMGMLRFTYPLGRHREKYLKSILQGTACMVVTPRRNYAFSCMSEWWSTHSISRSVSNMPCRNQRRQFPVLQTHCMPQMQTHARRPARKLDSSISHEQQHCRSTGHCSSHHPSRKNPEALTHGNRVRYTHTLMEQLGKLMTTSQAFPRSSHVHPTSLWRQSHL